MRRDRVVKAAMLEQTYRYKGLKSRQLKPAGISMSAASFLAWPPTLEGYFSEQVKGAAHVPI